MNKEERFFISLLSDHLALKKTEPQYDLEWKRILHLAQIHQVGGIVYFQCKSFIPDDVKPLFYKHYTASLYSYVNYTSEIKRIEQAFHEHGIEMFTVKGLEVAKYYPYPELRTMGDIDIVVQTSKRREADDILHQFHYESISHREDIEWEYYKQGKRIELHDCLIYNQVINKDKIERFFNNFLSYVKDGTIDVSFHFLYIIEHLKKHLLNSGVGFRQFMDLAVMTKSEPALDWKWINEKLDELGLKTFSSVCFAFVQRWFSITAPIDMTDIEEEFFEDATEKIFSNGVFGFDNTENVVNAAVNAARNNKIHLLGMIKGALKYVFPSYKDLSDKKFYPYLAGRPYLLPVSWIHRFIRGIWSFGRAKKNMRLKFTTADTIKERDRYLKKWDL